MTEQTNETTQEDADMATVRAVFEKASNAIVEASRLGRLVGELEAKVTALAQDLDWLRERNKSLDEQLNYVRKARDEAQEKVHDLERESRQLRMDYEGECNVTAKLRADLEAMTQRWHDASKERDEAMLREMELQDKLKEATATLDAIMKVLHPLKEVPTTQVTEVAQETPPQFEHSETTEERERREAQSRDEAGRFGPKVVGFDY